MQDTVKQPEHWKSCSYTLYRNSSFDRKISFFTRFALEWTAELQFKVESWSSNQFDGVEVELCWKINTIAQSAPALNFALSQYYPDIRDERIVIFCGPDPALNL